MYNLIQYSSNYSETTGSLWFYSKDETTDFNAYIVNDDNFKSFEYNAKLLGNTVADGANGILKNATIAVPLKYLRNLKLRWTKYCVLSVAGNENNINEGANVNNIIFTIKDTKLYVPIVSLSAGDNQKLSKLLSLKGLKDQFNGMKIQRELIIKIQQMNLDNFSNQILLE